MAKLDLLIRMSRQVTDERQLHLSEAAQAHVDATAALAAHDARIVDEYSIAAADPIAAAGFGNWVRMARHQARLLRQRQDAMARSEAAAHSALQEAFIDQKRFELAQDLAIETADLKSRRIADRAADEHERIRRGREPG